MGHKTLDNVIVEQNGMITLKSYQYTIRETFEKDKFKECIKTNYAIDPVLIDTFLKETGTCPVIEFEIPEDYDDIDGIKLIWKSRGMPTEYFGEVELTISNRTLSAKISEIPNYNMGDTVAILYHRDDILLCRIIQ